jgi:hypothetical protein
LISLLLPRPETEGISRRGRNGVSGKRLEPRWNGISGKRCTLNRITMGGNSIESWFSNTVTVAFRGCW